MPITTRTSYPNIRQNLHPDFANLPDHNIEAILQSRNVDAEAMEGFFDDLGRFASRAAKVAVQVAPSVLPIAGTVLGTAVGGPLGASLGGTLGSLAGKAIGGASGQAAPSGGSIPGLGAIGGIVSGLAGSPAASQLLQTFLKPQTMQALASMALGPMGRPNVPVNGSPVPVGAFTNLLSTLAGRAEAEYNASISATRSAVPKYMQDYAGEAKGDPAVAEHRAQALLELLESSGAEQESSESAEAVEAAEYESSEAEMEAAQAEYDAIEAAEMYESEYDFEEA